MAKLYVKSINPIKNNHIFLLIHQPTEVQDKPNQGFKIFLQIKEKVKVEISHEYSDSLLILPAVLPA